MRRVVCARSTFNGRDPLVAFSTESISMIEALAERALEAEHRANSLRVLFAARRDEDRKVQGEAAAVALTAAKAAHSAAGHDAGTAQALVEAAQGVLHAGQERDRFAQRASVDMVDQANHQAAQLRGQLKLEQDRNRTMSALLIQQSSAAQAAAQHHHADEARHTEDLVRHQGFFRRLDRDNLRLRADVAGMTADMEEMTDGGSDDGSGIKRARNHAAKVRFKARRK
jgi:hypothetical protein